MTEQKIWETILQRTGSEIFTAALMGNMKAESALRGNNLQNSYEKKLGYTDETYTNAIDQHRYTGKQFANDKAGYGLCQWTSSGRKNNMYNRWLNSDPACSIADETFQIDFCVWELQTSHKDIWSKRYEYKTIREATADILRKYERPADQSDANVDRRTAYAQAYYDAYAGVPVIVPVNSGLINQIKSIMDQIDCAQGIMDECMEKLEYIMEDLV